MDDVALLFIARVTQDGRQSERLFQTRIPHILECLRAGVPALRQSGLCQLGALQLAMGYTQFSPAQRVLLYQQRRAVKLAKRLDRAFARLPLRTQRHLTSRILRAQQSPSARRNLRRRPIRVGIFTFTSLPRWRSVFAQSRYFSRVLNIC